MSESQRKSHQMSVCIIRCVNYVEKQIPRDQLGILSQLLYALKYHEINLLRLNLWAA